ncbi:MAG: glycosyltransferase family 2 protein [Planctomycetes bacterium]|nr:glycosyltransferase family 2 protein [Planctomycetota bacterium]
MQSIAALVATRNRAGLLLQRTIPSILRQQRSPDTLVLVNDGEEHPESVHTALRPLCSRFHVELLHNTRTPGAGGAWNTGLQWLTDRSFDGFVALLDDDDTWDPQHLAANLRAACASAADLAVSGLRLYAEGQIRRRVLIERLLPRDFLIGNPGWQGSNTFVRLSALNAISGFDEELPSMHDRDVAVRLLNAPGISWALVPEWTATWNFGTPGCLTGPSPGKLAALRRFLGKHGAHIAPDDRRLYFERAQRLFGFRQTDIEQ